MRPIKSCALCTLASVLLALLLVAQAPPDYLTEEEIKKVRETQEPNKRILLFLEIAAARLSKFEQAVAATPPAHSDDLMERIDDFISALDDATSNLETWLERGGLDLNQAREAIDKQGAAFLAQLEKIDTAHKERVEEFQFTWDDAMEATREMLAVAKKIPKGKLPAKQPARVGTQEEKAAPGRPTLRKKGEAPKPPPRPPQPPPDAGCYGPA
ncbi:MAG: hypothetical protein ACE5H2_06080 [Terriglobia bacterium]